jgi:acetyltransferase-like isoleucine patch superfamily enzyme
MTSIRRRLAQRYVAARRLIVRARGRLFAVLAGPAFAGFGTGTVIQPPVLLGNEGRIRLGRDVYVGRDSWLHVEGPAEGAVAIDIGDGTQIVGHCVISAAERVTLGAKVLVARGVYISDHSHRFDDGAAAILDQGINRVAPVTIGEGAWLAENVVVCPGVTIGQGAVIGANSVVNRDVPAFAVAVGAPAQVLEGATTSAVTA